MNSRKQLNIGVLAFGILLTHSTFLCANWFENLVGGLYGVGSTAAERIVSTNTGYTWSSPLDKQVEKCMTKEYTSKGCSKASASTNEIHQHLDWRRLTAHVLLATALFAVAEGARAGWRAWHRPAGQQQPHETLATTSLRVAGRVSTHMAEALALCAANAAARYLPALPRYMQLPTLYNGAIDGIASFLGGK